MSCAAGARTLEAKDGQGARPGGRGVRAHSCPSAFFFGGGGAGTDYGGKREACPPVKIRARPRKFAFPCSRESPLLQSAGRFFAGVRGVAALVVLGFHVFEAFATSPFDQTFNHGYLAVDFFFMLSGFVIGYAYDARWRGNGNAGGMTTADFFKRRLVRLHPMICVGALLGVVSFFVQGRVRWDGTEVGVPAVALAFLLSIFLIPARPGTAAEIRGNGEMFPLNGPSWSLFFEYLGNIFYALVLRRLPTAALAAFVALAALGLTGVAAGNLSGFGHIGVGWSLADFDALKNTDNGAIGELFDNGLCGGLLRLGFSFPAGLLLARVFRPAKIRGAFWICAGCVAALLSAPYVGFRVPLHRVSRRVRKRARRRFGRNLPLPRRHFLPRLHHPLPVVLSFLRVDFRERTHVCGRMAGGAAARRRERPRGVSFPEIFRRTAASAAGASAENRQARVRRAESREKRAFPRELRERSFFALAGTRSGARFVLRVQILRERLNAETSASSPASSMFVSMPQPQKTFPSLSREIET